MSGPVIADAGPLIGLARVDHLSVLQKLYGEVVIPPAVAEELKLKESRPGSARLHAATEAGWLRVVAPRDMAVVVSGPKLDTGEEAAVALAVELGARFLLVDEQRGRKAAQRAGVPVVGVAGLLLVAKQRGQLLRVAPVLSDLEDVGYRLSRALAAEVLRRAGEV